jgi:hypothetical protein
MGAVIPPSRRAAAVRSTVAARAVFAICAVAVLAAGCGNGSGARWTGAPADSPAPSYSAGDDTSPVPSAAASPARPASGSPSAAAAAVPAGVTAGVAVFDRQSGTFAYERNVTMRFRSASLVKLLIALDYLWDRGPAYTIPATDRPRLDLMLRSSDDGAASHFWGLAGSGAVVTRMVGRLGLKDTTPPPPDRRGWGSTALSAADIVRVYRYLLDSAPAPVRDYIMGNLHQSTKCGTDGFDQSFGIPSAFGRPWAAKQGWYEFGGKPASPCAANAANPSTADAVVVPVAAPGGVDWAGEVLHTTGTVGAGDRWILAVLTLHRHGTPFATAAGALTRLTASLPGPPRG